MKKILFVVSVLMLTLVFVGCSAEEEPEVQEAVEEVKVVMEEDKEADADMTEEAEVVEDMEEDKAMEEDADSEEEADDETAAEVDDPSTFTLEELAAFDGKGGNLAYVAVAGVVYDVTDVPAWSGGKHNGNFAGQDATEAIKKAPHGDSKLKGLEIVGSIVE